MKKLFLFLLFTSVCGAQVVNIPNANLRAKLLSAAPTNFIASTTATPPFNWVKIDTNDDGLIQQSEALQIQYFNIYDSAFADITGLENFTNLIVLRLQNCQVPDLSPIDGLPNLEYLWMAQNTLTSVNLPNLPNLKRLDCSFNQLSGNLDATIFPNLRALDCRQNDLSSLTITGMDLQYLGCEWNALTTLDVSAAVSLVSLSCDSNQLTSLDLSHNPLISYLVFGTNPIASIDVSNLTKLTSIYCGGTPLTSLDLSNSPLLNWVSIYNPTLLTLNLKNGGLEPNLTISNSPNLQFICADEAQVATIQSMVGSGTVVSSYCNFEPGGSYNTVVGNARFDEDNNGCNIADIYFPYHLRLNLSDGVGSSGTFLNASGDYKLYAGTGTYTLNAQLENPGYFNVSPTTATFNFPELNNDEQSQNFCITANGNHPDLEIVLLPLTAARPGFEANYQIVYRNKGNQTLSGSVNFAFDDTRMDFVAANPIVGNQTLNTLLWNFSNLHPFEIRTIFFTLALNSPTENPPVDLGDLLSFISNITIGEGEETPLDNVAILSQVAVNAIDPNDKTCLEGHNVLPEHIGKYLHYNINFENIGTTNAVNIVVKDTIDTTRFDISSLQLLYASHPVYTKITGNVVEFIFEGINLPPSIMNPIGGHGNVLFKIKTLPTLAVGDEVANTANIFFDYNAPIDTNEARTAFNNLSKTNFAKDDSVTLYPNPAKNKVTVKAAGAIKSVQLYDVQGRILHTAIEDKNQVTLDLSNQQTGVYFLTVTTQKGSSTQKIIKE